MIILNILIKTLNLYSSYAKKILIVLNKANYINII